ncbi:MAG: acetate--CoA ligase family protein [Proteobacteria bacterium]|nr:acetate--CoA ligase family protein [Pseudomonadota bacterium]
MRSSDVLNPASVAIVGASSDPERIGGIPIATMLQQGFAGELWPVNPARSDVQGLRCYDAIENLPAAPDAAIVAVPGALAADAVEALARRGTRSAIVFSAGFAEAGAAGAELQQRMVRAAQASGLRLFGPNTIGLFNAHAAYYPFFSTAFERGFPLPGRIGIASQSGAVGSQIFNIARNRGMGTPLCITTGNEADVTLGEAIGWLVDHPGIDVIVAYLEGLRRPELLLQALEAARRARKPVIVHKGGRSALGASAVQSHTAAIAGDDRLFDVVLDEFGAVRAEHTEQMLDIAYAAARRIYPVAGTLGVLTLSGGAGIQMSDAAERAGLAMPQMDGGSQQRLQALLPFASPVNPIDITAQSLNDIDLVGHFAREVAERGGYEAIAVYLAGVGGSLKKGPVLRRSFADVARAHPDRLWTILTTADREAVAAYEQDGLLVFEEPARAIHAIGALARFGRAFARPEAPALSQAMSPATTGAPLPATVPNEAEAKAWLASHGVACLPEALATDAQAAAAAAQGMGFPVVLKIVSPDIAHKSEVGGVQLDLRSAGEVRSAFAAVTAAVARARPDARIDGVLVAPQIADGVECLVSVHRDPQLGLFAAFGLGGIFVELLQDVVFRRCPFDEAAAHAMIAGIRGAPLLRGARGRPPADVDALARLLSRLSVLAHRHGERLRSIELNPVLVRPAGLGAWAADAVIELAAAGSGETRPCENR